MKKIKMVGQVLTKSEQKSIMGGASDGEIYYGACDGGTNCWYYVGGATFATCLGDVASKCSEARGACSAYELSCSS